jgi:signal transduction histidine kinase/DNA-binding response OmpR family regulator/streptogramin lyase
LVLGSYFWHMTKQNDSFPLLLIGLFLGWSVMLWGQNFSTQFNSYDVEDGLSHRFINVIEQDKNGFIWVGTNYGLNRFDGQEFQVFQLVNLVTQERQISNIQFDQKGRLWLRFNRGVGDAYNIFDPLTEELLTVEEAIGYPLPSSLKEEMIAQPLKDGSVLFLGGQSDSIYIAQVNGIKGFRLNLKEGELLDAVLEHQHQLLLHTTYADPSKNCRAIHMDKNGQIKEEYFIQSPNCQILHYNNDSMFVLNSADQRIYLCYKHQDPQVLLHKADHLEKVKHRANSMKAEFLFRDPNRPEVLKMLDYAGRLKKEVSLAYIDKFNTYDINTSFIDRDGAIWFANFNYFSLGYIQIQENYFQKYLYEYRTTRNSLQSTRGILSYKDSLLFVNSFEDCFQINLKSGAVSPLNFPKDINNLAQLSASILKEDTIWTVSSNGFLYQYHIPSQALKTYPVKNKAKGALTNAQLLSLKQLENGKILIGAKRGLYYLDALDQVVYPYEDYGKDSLLQTSVINYIYENQEGIWFCSSSGLYLQKSSTNEIERFHQKGKGKFNFPYNQIAYLHEDANQIFWIASKGGGLIRWDRKNHSFEQYGTKEGLSHDVVYAVFEDQNNSLWLSSDRGIMRFDKSTKGVVTYLPKDGISHEEFNTFSYHQTKNGKIYFGGLNGVTGFEPEKFIPKTEQDPTFLITDFLVKSGITAAFEKQFNRYLKEEVIILQAHEHAFILKFALLDYSAPSKIRYAYKIEDLDKDWVVSTEAQIRMNKLPYGNYNLYLRAQSPNGKWIDYPKVIPIQIIKPFYLQIWFILLAVFSVLGLIYLFFRFRLRYLEQRKRELEAIVVERTAKIEEDRQLIEQQSEELKALDKAKSRFFANVSHELRTPLTLILGPLSYILDQEEDLEKEELRQQLKSMQRNGKSLLQLVEEIMDLSKQDAHKLELQEDVVVMGDFFRTCFDKFQDAFQHKGIRASFHISEALEHASILLDHQKFEKILNNYLSNALKFTPKGGSIHLSIAQRAENFILSVQDSGNGISAKDLKHVFERFYQAEHQGTSNYGGTGIGLALVKEYADLMQAKAYVESQEGEGSCFYFNWPVKTFKEAKALQSIDEELLSETEAIHSIGTDFNLLVIEDNSDMQAFIKSILSKHYQVYTADHGLEALKILEDSTQKIDLIVSDLMMPEMDGFELLKRVKSKAIWQKIPVIMLTALKREKEKLEALTIGVDDYLNKPFSVAELLVRVQNLLYNYHQRKHWKEDLKEEEEMISPPPSDQLEEQAWVHEIKTKILELSQEQTPTVEELAQAFFLSARQFHRRLKKATGLTPAKFIREVQLDKARDLLESGKAISVTQTAYSCGFDVPDTFSRLYKQRYGKSPSEYL